MFIQNVSIGPSSEALKRGCHVLSPELLAASAARYSRNNEGINKIVEKITVGNV